MEDTAEDRANRNGHEQAYPDEKAYGLTKRELFAAMVLQGMMACEHAPVQCAPLPFENTYAKKAVEQADALLAALER